MNYSLYLYKENCGKRNREFTKRHGSINMICFKSMNAFFDSSKRLEHNKDTIIGRREMMLKHKKNKDTSIGERLGNPLLGDKEFLQHEYWQKKRSPKLIGKQLGCSAATVKRALKNLEIPLKSLTQANSDRKTLGYPGRWKNRSRFYANRLFLIVFHCFLRLENEKIAKIAGCSERTIQDYVNDFGLPKKVEAHINHSDYPPFYNNRLFLITFYCFLELTPEEIAPIAKCGGVVLNRKVKELLPYCYRDKSEAKILLAKKKALEEYSYPIDRVFKEQLIASMLGYGSISSNMTHDGDIFLRYGNTAFFSLGQKEIHSAYVESLANKVKNTGLGFIVKYKTNKTLLQDGTPSYQTRFRTMGSIELMEWFWDWYRFPTEEEKQRNPRVKHIKILPKWLTVSDFTPYMLYVWHIEDGYYIPKSNQIHLCSLNFNEAENERLADFLREVLNISPNSDDIKVLSQKGTTEGSRDRYYYIRLKRRAIKKFFAYIRPYWRVFPTYSYKFP